jgi:2-polyprenyl-6-methoxyphenol hydroxylase-like FAD-dependent oxidoreductase
MKILVYGAGPLGSLFAGRLHQAGHAVSLLARGQRLDDEFRELARQTSVPTPASERLYAYFDPATPRMPQGSAEIPLEAGIRPGDRLLAVRCSGMALGLMTRGPSHALALKHAEVETFGGRICKANE